MVLGDKLGKQRVPSQIQPHHIRKDLKQTIMLISLNNRYFVFMLHSVAKTEFNGFVTMSQLYLGIYEFNIFQYCVSCFVGL